ncbi:bifunctional demethylmenaquinone methyltransferase/2-methoxy-6-polyprenyl-1,4-benzoquinol methylase UbiE [Magnetococcales bacterium HHB-1]
MTDSTTTHFGFDEIPLSEKVLRVGKIFDSVADNYDLMNDLMSLGVHRLWKRYAIHKLKLQPNERALDVAAGTGDLSYLLHRKMADQGRVTLLDINESMLLLGRDRLIDAGLLAASDFVVGNAESIPLPDNHFHAITIGFGIRNVTEIKHALKEMVRVLRPGGQLMVLEFSQVAIPFLRPIYDLYSFKILPEIGSRVADDREAYQYLVESIRRFPEQEAFRSMLEECGLGHVQYYNLSGGIAAIHLGFKV